MVSWNVLAEKLELPDYVIYSFSNIFSYIFSPFLGPFEYFINSSFTKELSLIYRLQKTPYSSTPLSQTNPTNVLFALVTYFLLNFLFLLISIFLGKRRYTVLATVHNSFLFFLSIYMAVTFAITALACNYSLVNNKIGRTANDYRMAKIFWIFLVSKIPEFADTFLILLKQSYHHYTFLHLYYHISILLVCYIIFIISPGGDPYIAGLLNSTFHIFKYGYYLGTTIFKEGRMRNFLNSFKFIIKKILILQFTIILVHALYMLWIPKPNYPKSASGLMAFYMFSLLLLYGHFLFTDISKRNEQEAKLSDQNLENIKKTK